MRIIFNVLLVFLSAFLLFLIQPIFAKIILPWFGGSAGVWSICLVFFQTTLLLGYLYSHLLQSLNRRQQTICHLTIIILIAAIMPFIFSNLAQPSPDANPYANILAILAIHLGLPFFLLSTTSVLAQSWHANENRPSKLIYELYAYSNVGSLLALLSYPFFIEPKIPLSTQLKWWMIAFEIYAGIYVVSTLWNHRFHLQKISLKKNRDEKWPHGAKCFLLALTGSALLVAFTNHLCFDIASFPFLWIAPLAIYLLTFIFCFSRKSLYSRVSGVLAMLFMMIVVVNPLDIVTRSVIGNHIVTTSAILMLALFACLMVVHGEMVLSKPKPESLTRFYLLMCSGSAVGSALVSFVAPVIFKSYYEYGLLLAALFIYGIYLLVFHTQTAVSWNRHRLTACALMIFAVSTISLAMVDYLVDEPNVTCRWRNFYGALRRYDLQDYRKLIFGEIVHGGCALPPYDSNTPITYYSQGSAPDLVWKHLRQTRQRPLCLGVVGMGTGTLAIYGNTGDTVRFYEINPLIPRIAREHFPFLKNTSAKVEVVMGDARLSLERELSQQFDLLALDAFSADAVPMHLLTKEAFATYLRHVKEDGFILVHVTNRHLSLIEPMTCMARALGLQASCIYHTPTIWPNLTFSTTYIVLSRHPFNLNPNQLSTTYFDLIASRKQILWTDQFNSPLDALKTPQWKEEMPLLASLVLFFQRVLIKMKINFHNSDA